jgi:hypothetical protein
VGGWPTFIFACTNTDRPPQPIVLFDGWESMLRVLGGLYRGKPEVSARTCA